jgi:hypothetical protein
VVHFYSAVYSKKGKKEMPKKNMLKSMVLAIGCLLSIFSQAALQQAQGAQMQKSPVVKNTLQITGDALYQKPDPSIQTRWFTFENRSAEKGGGGKADFGRKGSPAPVVKAKEKFVLADIKDSGTIRRIWITIDKHGDPAVLRGVKLEMFWDDANTPAVQAPIGDFFCHSFGRIGIFENAFFSSPEGRSFNCYIPMPFKKAAKIQVTNETDMDLKFFYEVDCTLGDNHGDSMLYFHSYWRRENISSVRNDMTILPKVEGVGRFLGCNLGIRQNPAFTKFWWGEGEVKIYLDGDKEYPTLCGTGSEDYVGTGWGQGRFINQYQGNQFMSDKGSGMFKDFYGFYRFHVPDPVYFHKDIRVTIQCIAGATTNGILAAMKEYPQQKYMKTGDGSQYFTAEELEKAGDCFFLLERQDDYCATAYWYLDTPQNNFPALPSIAERTKDLP